MYKIISTVIFLVSTITSFGQVKITADSAAKHFGETVTICSTVYGVKALDKVTFINVGSAYPNVPLSPFRVLRLQQSKTVPRSLDKANPVNRPLQQS